MEYVRLNNGLQMSAEGLGTFMLSPADAAKAYLSLDLDFDDQP